jgi:RNA polymerase sigma factor (TIGR02999 family)
MYVYPDRGARTGFFGMNDKSPEITRQLAESREDPRVRSDFFEAIHSELLKLARAELARHRRGATLNTQVLVNEAYLKLFRDERGSEFCSRKHFFASAAQAMRHIVIDYARRKLAERRGAGVEAVDIDSQIIAVDSQAEQLLALDCALKRLAERDQRLAEIVELRFFAGLPVEELSEVLNLSPATIKRDTRVARAFLSKELGRVASV